MGVVQGANEYLVFSACQSLPWLNINPIGNAPAMPAQITHLRDTDPVSPDAILGNTIGLKPKSVVVVALDDTGKATITWSTMTNGELCAALVSLQNSVSSHMQWGER